MTADPYPWLTAAGHPQIGPCRICGTGLAQRHRVMDAIAERVAAGDDPADEAAEYGMTVDLVERIAAEYDGTTDRWEP